MATQRPIRTPIRVRLRRARERALPAVVFTFAAVMTGLLWTSQAARPQLIGEVVALEYELRSAADGVLVSVPGSLLNRFDQVRAGQIVVQLDDTPLLAEHSTMLTELARLRSVLTAAEREALTEAAEFDLDALTLARRLAVDVESLRLDVVSLTARIQADDSRLQRAEVVLTAAQQAFDQGVENSVALEELRLRRDEIAQRLEGQRAELIETQSQLVSANDRLDSLGTPEGVAELDIVLAPLRAEIAVHESRVRELEIEASRLTLRSPIEGTISSVFARPGQPVREGDPLLMVSSPTPHGIVAYFRDPGGLDKAGIESGGEVEVLPMNGSAPFRASINAVGASVEPIPERLLRNPSLPEWGRAVWIAIPESSALTPGELVSIRMVRGV